MSEVDSEESRDMVGLMNPNFRCYLEILERNLTANNFELYPEVTMSRIDAAD